MEGEGRGRLGRPGEIYRARALELLRDLGDGEADLVFYDPPYNVGKDYGEYQDDRARGEYLEWMREVAREARRVARRGVGIYLSWQLLEDFWTEVLPDSDPIIIHKRSSGAITSDRGIMQHHHAILTTAEALRPVKSVWTDIRLPGEGYLFREGRHGNPGQTSLAATRRFVERFSEEGDLVADPFLGVGTTAVAASQLGRRYTGCDLSPDFLATASDRLRQRRVHEFFG